MGMLLSVVFSEEMKRIARSKWVGDKPKIKRKVLADGHVNYYEEGVTPPIPAKALARSVEECEFSQEKTRHIFRKKPHLKSTLLQVDRVRFVSSADDTITLEFETEMVASVIPESITLVQGELHLSYRVKNIRHTENQKRLLFVLESQNSVHPDVQAKFLQGDYRCDLYLDGQVRSFTKKQLIA